MAQDNETVKLISDEERQRLANDPMFRLEYGKDERERTAQASSRVADIRGVQNRMKDDYAVSQLLRKKFRVR